MRQVASRSTLFEKGPRTMSRFSSSLVVPPSLSVSFRAESDAAMELCWPAETQDQSIG